MCVLVPFKGRRHGFFNGLYFRAGDDDEDLELTMEKRRKFLPELDLLSV